MVVQRQRQCQSVASVGLGIGHEESDEDHRQSERERSISRMNNSKFGRHTNKLDGSSGVLHGARRCQRRRRLQHHCLTSSLPPSLTRSLACSVRWQVAEPFQGNKNFCCVTHSLTFPEFRTKSISIPAPLQDKRGAIMRGRGEGK